MPAGTPVVLVAHQPKEVREAAAAGVDLQLSGHTHGGQIWPFHLIVRVEQGALQGLSRSGAHTQLYTTRGVGFWGPPFRVFAPNEISLLTLRSGTGPGSSAGRCGSRTAPPGPANGPGQPTPPGFNYPAASTRFCPVSAATWAPTNPASVSNANRRAGPPQVPSP